MGGRRSGDSTRGVQGAGGTRWQRSKDIAEVLLEIQGPTYAEELGIDVGRARPADLFELLCAAVLFSARIAGAHREPSLATASELLAQEVEQ